MIYGTSELDKNVKTSVKVSQPSGGVTEADGVIYGTSKLDDKPAKTSVKVSQPSGGLRHWCSVTIVDETQRESTRLRPRSSSRTEIQGIHVFSQSK